LASGFNNYAAHLLKARRWKEARQSAAKSLSVLPTALGFRLLLEATFPKTFYRVAEMLDGGRA
jgi:hypothetical protein